MISSLIHFDWLLMIHSECFPTSDVWLGKWIYAFMNDIINVQLFAISMLHTRIHVSTSFISFHQLIHWCFIRLSTHAMLYITDTVFILRIEFTIYTVLQWTFFATIWLQSLLILQMGNTYFRIIDWRTFINTHMFFTKVFFITFFRKFVFYFKNFRNIKIK